MFDDADDYKFNVIFEYNDGHVRSGNMNVNRLKDYIDQLEIPKLRE